jgi:hypothetical protein
MAEVLFKRLTGWQAELRSEAIADMYTESYRRAPGVAVRERGDFLGEFAGDARHPGFAMVLASDQAPAGCVYGFPAGQERGWWTERIAARRDLFVVVGLMVLPSHRRNHLATQLQGKLIGQLAGAGGAAALIERANVPARSAFHQWGWKRTAELEAEDGRPAQEVWGRDCGLA